uniref:Uncharacterized protein n=1 Tax=Magallana gigas TaxID=29159 RepID=A0A8W8KNN8_MAGGI
MRRGATFQNMKWGVPFVSLRLPDVIGPRDNTYSDVWRRARGHLYIVTLGPVNTSLAERELSWNPSPLTETERLVIFYESASIRNPNSERAGGNVEFSTHCQKPTRHVQSFQQGVFDCVYERRAVSRRDMPREREYH